MAYERQKPNTYALTISTFQQHRHFQKTENAELFIATLFRYRDAGRFQLHGFVVMPDHVHVLLTPALNQPTARSVQLLKGGYSHAHGAASIWHTGHHEHRIRDAADYTTQLTYIANNPTRKHYEHFPRVHTAYASLLDPRPPHLS